MKRKLIKKSKKKRGFTLIELLAVILILGIIALIAIPTVNSVIEQSRRGAYEATTRNIISAIENECALDQMDGLIKSKYYTVTNGDLDSANLPIKGGNIDTFYAKVDVDTCKLNLVATYEDYCAVKDFDGELKFSSKDENGNCVISEDGQNDVIVSTLDSEVDSCFMTDGNGTIIFYNQFDPNCPSEVINIPDKVGDETITTIGPGSFLAFPPELMGLLQQMIGGGVQSVGIISGNSKRGLYDSAIDYVYLVKNMNSLDDLYVVINPDGVERKCFDSNDQFLGYKSVDYIIEENDGIAYCTISKDQLVNNSSLYHVQGNNKVLNFSNAKHLKTIMDGAFASGSVEEIIFGDIPLSSFGQGSFTYNLNLKNIDFSSLKELKTLPYFSFAYSNLDKVVLPPNIEKIELGAFSFSNVDEISDFPSSLKNIEKFAFRAANLKSIKLNQGLTTIGEGAFAQNRGRLDVVEIPSSVTRMDFYVFYGSKINKLIINNKQGVLSNAPWGIDASKIVYTK